MAVQRSVRLKREITRALRKGEAQERKREGDLGNNALAQSECYFRLFYENFRPCVEHLERYASLERRIEEMKQTKFSSENALHEEKLLEVWAPHKHKTGTTD